MLYQLFQSSLSEEAFNELLNLTFTLNGAPVRAEVEPHRTLLWLVGEGLELTGAKEGWGVGAGGSHAPVPL